MKPTYEELEQMISMQAEFISGAMNHVGTMVNGNMLADIAQKYHEVTSEIVAAWRAKETEPLRREVAMLRGRLEDYMAAAPELCDDNDENAMRDTQATALAYEREVENRGAVKALEDAIIRLHNDNSLLTNSDYEAELARIAEELRAANKGEVK